MLKFGMASPAVQRAIGSGEMSATVFAIATSPSVLLGFGLYFLSAITWLFVLSKIQLSYAYPFAALGFVFTTIFARIFIGEDFTTPKVAGTLLIICGVLVLARGMAATQ
jgi:multidrug transporter EmrE-like cation transporter